MGRAWLTGSAWAAVTAANGSITRGVLPDIARVRDMQWLEPGQGVFPDDLEEAARRQGVRVRSGDAVLLRTGATLKPAEVADFLHRRPEPLALARPTPRAGSGALLGQAATQADRRRALIEAMHAKATPPTSNSTCGTTGRTDAWR